MMEHESSASKDSHSTPFTLFSKESSFRFFFELSPLPMLIFDRETTAILRANTAAAQHYGYPEKEFLSMTLAEIVHPQESKTFLESSALAMKQQTPSRSRCRYRQKDGTYVAADVARYAILYDGKATGLSIHFDIASHESALKDLRNTEEKFQAFMEHNPATAWIKDENFRYVYCNPNVENLLQAKLGSLIGKTDFELYSDNIANQLRENDIHVLRSGEPLKTVEAVPDKDGQIRYWAVNKFIIPGPDGTRMIAGEAYDITEQKKAEEKIRFQASLLNQVRNAVIVTTRDMKVIYWNRFAEVMYQWKSEEVIGRSIFEVAVPENSWPLASAVIKESEQNGHWEGEFVVQRKDKSCFSVLVTNATLKNEQGEVIGFIGITSDLTDYKASQKALQEKNIALKEILGQLEFEKREIRDKLAGNIDKFVLPILKKMKKKLVAADSKSLENHVEMLERSLQDVAAPLSIHLSSKLKRLTQKELEICNLPRGGLSSKEIAKILEISPATVETHRVRIRHKLKIEDRKVNLTSYLQIP